MPFYGACRLAAETFGLGESFGLRESEFRFRVGLRIESPLQTKQNEIFLFCELRAFRSEPDSGFVVEELCVLDRLRELQPNPIPGAGILTPIEPFIPVLIW